MKNNKKISKYLDEKIIRNKQYYESKKESIRNFKSIQKNHLYMNM